MKLTQELQIVQFSACTACRHAHAHWTNSDGTTSQEFADKVTAHHILRGEITDISESQRADAQFAINNSRLALLPEDVDLWVRQQVDRLNRARFEELQLDTASFACLLDAAAGIEG